MKYGQVNSSALAISADASTIPKEHEDKVVEKPIPLRRVVSGAALDSVRAGSAGQPKTPTSENPDLRDYGLSEVPRDEGTIEQSIFSHLTSTLLKTSANINTLDAYLAAAFSVRERLLRRWNQTNEYHNAIKAKRVYYMSLEFLIGRTFDNAVLALDLKDEYKRALSDLGLSMEDCMDEERDAALGNGGLGRLAACYVDSMACKNYAGWGYGLRYKYGMFQQQIIDGAQVEAPDCWLEKPNPWEFPRYDISYTIRFYGHLSRSQDDSNKIKWEGGVTYDAMAYDVPVPGYGTHNVGNIRLWSCKTNDLFDLRAFNEGRYRDAMGGAVEADNLTNVLYPNDNHNEGKELRLKQEYLFCSATLQDIIARFKLAKLPWSEFPDKVAIQLNDTHPTLGIPELQRILIDEEGLEWEEAWDIVRHTFAFTNHTILPEAMEKWPVPMLSKILPRHMSIIYDINLFFLQKVEKKFPDDKELLSHISIIEESSPQQVRMAYLACVGSHHVNGVAEIHSDIIKKTIFSDFVRFYGADKFMNKTNGVSPRRWMLQCNPKMSSLITEIVGDESWVNDLSKVKLLEEYADDASFRKRWWDAKQANKERLAKFIEEVCGITVSPHSLFDIQVKRIHEYKRQLLNVLGLVHRYNEIKDMSAEQKKKLVPRVAVFAGKAASGYWMAKQIIRLINAVADVVNKDAEIGELLKIVFIPDYGVTVAEHVVPASDISEHISTAGTEASGTSNMKFVMNGGLIIGTVDGANVEIAEEVGDDNIITFGVLAHEVEHYRHQLRFGHISGIGSELAGVFRTIKSGTFGDHGAFQPIIDSILHGGDTYLVSIDFPSYISAQKALDDMYLDREAWIKRSILCVARTSKFSSDRSIEEYAEEIWNIEPLPVADSH